MTKEIKKKIIEFALTQTEFSSIKVSKLIINWQKFLLQNDETEVILHTKLLTGILSIDSTLGGLYTGITQIYGIPDSYKTALSLTLAANMSKLQKTVSIFMNADNKALNDKIVTDNILQTQANVKTKKGSYRTSEYLKEVVLKNGLTNLIFIDSITNVQRYANVLKTLVKMVGHIPNLFIFFTNQSRKGEFNFVPAGQTILNSTSNYIIKVEKEEKVPKFTMIQYLLENGKTKERFVIYFDNEGKVSNEIYLMQEAFRLHLIEKSNQGNYVYKNQYGISKRFDIDTNGKELFKKVFPKGDLQFENYFSI